MAALFTLFSTVEKMENTDPALGLWLICLFLCKLSLDSYVGKERSVRAVLYLISGFFVVQLLLTLLIYGAFSSFAGMLIALAMWVYSYYNCYELLTKKLTAERLSRSFDLSCCVLIFLVFFCLVKQLPLSLVFPLSLSILYALLALVLVRGGGERRLKSVSLSAALIAAIAFLTLVLSLLFTGGVKRLVTLISELIYFLLSGVYRFLNSLFLLLMSLIPQKEYEQIAPELMESQQGMAAQDMSFKIIDGEAFIILVLCIAFTIGLLLLACRIFKGNKKQHTVAAVNAQTTQADIGLKYIIKTAVARFIASLVFKMRCITARNTAPGLFNEIEKRSYTKLHGRAEGESCREFILRAITLYPWANYELCKLADAMDILHFGSGAVLSGKEIVQMRKIIFKSQEIPEL